MKNKGLEFEAVLAKSWAASGINLVRQKITENGEQKPCDERVDFDNFRLFNELKSTQNKKFDVRKVSLHQLRSLRDWHKKFGNSIGTLCIEFQQFKRAFFVDIETLSKYFTNKDNSILAVEEIKSILHYEIKSNGEYYIINDDFLDYLRKIKGGNNNGKDIKTKI